MSALSAVIPTRSLTLISHEIGDSTSAQFLAWQENNCFIQNDVITSGVPRIPEIAGSSSSSECRRPNPVGTIPGTGRILCGVAVLANDLYVARNFSSIIDLYDVRTRDFRLSPRGVEVTGLRDPVDIAACRIHRMIYVSGSNDKSIFKIEGRSKTVIGRWRLDSRPFGLSVSRQKGTVMVTFLDETAIKEFTPDGQELRGIKLDPDSFANPWHCLGFSSNDPDHVLLCHGWSKDRLTCVSLVDVTEGYLLGRYGGPRGSSRSTMDLPSHALVDPGQGHALIVDLNNSRILRLRLPGKSGFRAEVESVILSDSDGLKWPRSLAFDVVQQRLFVGLHEGPVLIFDYRKI